MDFWGDKTILITGAGGFVGLNLLNELLRKQVKVVTFTRKVFDNYLLLNQEGDKKSFVKQEVGLIENINFLNKIIKNNNINLIYHLAAQTLVEVGQESPLQTFETNVRGTYNVLECARRNNIKKVVIASTTHVYGDNPNLPYKEDYYPQPSRPYETSKACADLIAQSYADTYSLPVEISRMVNVYGPGDFNFTRIIPKVIRSVILGENPKIWDVGATRDFLYIDDAVKAYLTLAEKKLPNEKRHRVFNFGSGSPVRIADLAEMIIKISGKKDLKIDYQPVPEQRSKEIPRQYVSIQKAETLLGWKPTVSLEEGLKRTYSWYEKYFTGMKNT